ncbi:hypothetical protein AVEN_207774-1 [Araneus ventricosus]|uniref:Uncharacterized protein n=1 Tax=Araneus ventricosus TaxID=182803 RepID=A0A4Y2BWP7_ARAVE|nr:hypothetical protein AVEN_207774-1 [Araneus ventricosus]
MNQSVESILPSTNITKILGDTEIDIGVARIEMYSKKQYLGFIAGKKEGRGIQTGGEDSASGHKGRSSRFVSTENRHVLGPGAREIHRG